MANETKALATGWTTWLTRVSLASILFLGISGLAVTLAPFHRAVEWGVILHTVVGLVTLLPFCVYLLWHWRDYRRYSLSDVVWLGYLATAALLVCSLSGVVVTWQGLFGLRMSPAWQMTHLVSTLVGLVATLPHVVLVAMRLRGESRAPIWGTTLRATGLTVVGLAVVALFVVLYPPERYTNLFPADYTFPAGEDRPFAPSLAVTSTGGAFDARSLSGSESCGTSGCHQQIVEEWLPSAHRYSAMDPLFQKVQSVMAEQNGPESTRYCGGCHDPISLFAGAKRLMSEGLTGEAGYNEGISCLSCHGIRETDLQGNANYVMTQPPAYLWQWESEGGKRLVRDFLIRTYPAQHNGLSKRMFKAPEYCAACHKQFIDEEVNRVGWVQLQNQYDNWKASHWFVDGDPAKTVECRECHMPLIASTDPAAGDVADYNRSPGDGMHRSHRFIAANSMVPTMLKLPGWEKQVELTKEWLAGTFEIPEIADKWATGPVVQLALEVPERVAPGEAIPIRLLLSSNKVGHDFPTGPLDIIQSWVEMHVVDEAGAEVFSTGTRDEKNFIEPGSFLFKAEPVDQYGNLIDRHNLWEMVGVRYRRALFPGYSDTVEFLVDCPSAVGEAPAATVDEGVQLSDDQAVRSLELPAAEPGKLQVTAVLYYRKVDQFLINFLLGEDSGLTAPVLEMHRVTASIDVTPPPAVAELATESAAARIGG